ncbi:MAG: hypothetical protein ABSG17_13215 [Spirochaetia bacterium]|jgi:hypothetical protein
MKKILCAAALIAAALTTAFAQGGSVTIQNEESVTFYYTVDPPQLPQFSAGSPSAATKIAEFFAAQSSTPEFVPLAPGAQASLTGLPDGAHLLVGFFAVEGQDAFPVRVMTLQADSSMGERFYAIYGSPALLEAARGVGRLAQFTAPAASEQAAAGPATETQPQAAPAAKAAAGASESTAAAQAAPAAAHAAPAAAAAPLLSFSRSYDPVVFTRELQGGFSVQPIASSHSWTLAGTHITALNARIDQGTLSLTLTTADGFSPDVSYFFYAFAERTAGTPAAFTLELRPRALPDRGACILWQRAADSSGGSAPPRIFGSVKVEGKTAALAASLTGEPPDLVQALSAATSFDLTSCWFDKPSGTYEEFYFATVAAADILSKR